MRPSHPKKLHTTPSQLVKQHEITMAQKRREGERKKKNVATLIMLDKNWQHSLHVLSIHIK